MTDWSRSAKQTARWGARSSRTWPLRCRARPAAARRTHSRCARESGTPTARPCGRPTSAAVSSASSASALFPPTTRASSADRRARRHPRRCDLHAGIVTNDAAGTVTFRLGQADPDFLYKLALVLAAPAPPGAPGHLIDRAPFLPGTGPYMISQYRPGSSLTLVRNPRFRQWSYAAQPAGYPHVIRFEQMADPRQQQAAVAAGRADLVDISITASRPALWRSGTRPGSTPASSLAPFTCSSIPGSRHSPASRPGRPSTTPSTAPGSSSFSASAPPGPPRHARSCRPAPPATSATAPTRPAHRTARGTARTWPRRCGSRTSPAPRRCR